MIMSNLDIINLPYPMFPVTQGEKVLLRKAEIEFASYNDEWDGLCCVLEGVARVGDWGIVGGLVEKIQDSLYYDYDSYGGGQRFHSYLHQYLFDSHIYYVLNPHQLNMLRRVWITKLLNQ